MIDSLILLKDSSVTGLTRGSQVSLRCFQGFLASSSILVVDVTLTAVQPCFKEGDLINPVALVLALMVSHSRRKNPVHAPFIEEDRPSRWKDGLSRSFVHGFPVSRSGGGESSSSTTGMGWTLLCLASDTPAFPRRGPSRMPLLARGEVSGLSNSWGQGSR